MSKARTVLNGGISRRTVLRGIGGLAAGTALSAPLIGKSMAADTLVVRDAGGLYQTAVVEAYYKPFTKETGVQIVPASATADPLAQVKAMVDAKSYTWDVVLNRVGLAELLGQQNYLEEIDWSGADMKNLIPKANNKYCMGTDVFASVYGYRTDRVKGEPKSWSDFWDVKKFPGSRSMSKSPYDTLEEALLADGVEPSKLYPLDIKRALKKLDQLRPNVPVWWGGGAQAAQLLQTGEVEFVATWNGRIQPVIEGGAPVKIVWDKGLYGVEGFTIPKGNPKRDLCQKFIQYCANAERQANFAKIMSYGPTNPKAFDYLPKERAEILPTSPTHFGNMIYQDHDYWGKNQEKALEQFNLWLLG